MLCKNSPDNQPSVNELPALHEVEQLHQPDNQEYCDMDELVKPGTPPPQFHALMHQKPSLDSWPDEDDPKARHKMRESI